MVESDTMVTCWHPAYGHPNGPSDGASFVEINGWGCRVTEDTGRASSPSFRILDGHAYPTLDTRADTPTFELVGSFAYRDTGPPWFRLETRAS